MIVSKRTVNVQQMPEQVNAANERLLLQYLQKKCAETERPRFVLDCSPVRGMDTATIQLLLSCLEEVMKCNGDVRLASLRPEAGAALRLSGVCRLFETYESTEAAVQSFQKRPSSMAPLEIESDALDLNSGLAA
jgi:anti-anti-sigma factor